MNIYLKNFFMRGLVFSGLGPIILGVVYFFVERNTSDFSLSAGQILLGIVSTYLLAFLQAGASVFNQIEHWPVAKQSFCHFVTLYVAYLVCYTLNSWIPFKIEIVGIFTAIFVVIYLVIWLTVYFSVKKASKKLNKAIN